MAIAPSVVMASALLLLFQPGSAGRCQAPNNLAHAKPFPRFLRSVLRSNLRVSAARGGEASVSRRGRTQVMTDIDDTVKSSGGKEIAGVYLGGIDKRYPRGTFYPAVFQFGLELSRNGLKDTETPFRIAVLTARAEELKIFLEITETSPIARGYKSAAVKSGIEWGVGRILYGSLREWIFQEEMANRKFDNFLKLKEEIRGEDVGGYIFIGDTGLYDRNAAERMCMESGSDMLAIFLHDVGTKKESDSTIPQSDYICNGVPILHFKTYIGAAAKALLQGLISLDGMERVMDQANIDLNRYGTTLTIKQAASDYKFAESVINQVKKDQKRARTTLDELLISTIEDIDKLNSTELSKLSKDLPDVDLPEVEDIIRL